MKYITVPIRCCRKQRVVGMMTDVVGMMTDVVGMMTDVVGMMTARVITTILRLRWPMPSYIVVMTLTVIIGGDLRSSSAPTCGQTFLSRIMTLIRNVFFSPCCKQKARNKGVSEGMYVR